MPRSRSIHTYPQSFWTMLEQAATAKKSFEFDVKTIPEGLSMQGKFYAFRGALVKEQARLSIMGPASGEAAVHKERVDRTLRFSQEVVCFVDRDTLKVHIMHRDETPEAKLFEEALVRGGGKKLEDQLSESARRIMEQTTDEGGGKYG